jgi:hypothetical protein
MAFEPLKLKPESGATRICDADVAASFIMYMSLERQNMPRWQMARQALNQAGASRAGEYRARQLFQEALISEDWLDVQGGQPMALKGPSDTRPTENIERALLPGRRGRRRRGNERQ